MGELTPTFAQATLYAMRSRPKEPFMRDHRNTQPHLFSQILRLHVTLSDRLDAAAIE